MAQEVTSALEALYRSDWGRIVAALIRLFGDFAAAEEAPQEAVAAAVDQRPGAGVAEDPGCGHSLHRAGDERAAGTAGCWAHRDLPGLQRRVRGDEGRSARAWRSVRGGDPSWPVGANADGTAGAVGGEWASRAHAAA